MMQPLVSVIIPCYNQGSFIQEALDSLSFWDANLIETIIINDGSTDSFTNQYLADLKGKGYNVIFQENKGLGEARNTGIRASIGKYIVPLDADNKLLPGYKEGLNILENDPQIAVLYGDRNFFGDKQGIEITGEFNLQRLMLGNYIDACAIIRKSVLEEVGYYDPMKIMGFEDWDLWLRIAFKGYGFYYLNAVTFEYRFIRNSMMRSLNADIKKQNEIELYLIQKYKDKLDYELLNNHFVYRVKKAPFNFFWRLVLKKYFYGYYDRLIRENKIYRGFLYQKH
ncbi:glycosyltransferase family 2 protein [Parasediminibacterium sp. JCM 36343]|uniref:glycosyltransferase family 2 protein n=1 Tax=Parasediminibacterium sp. JCM 36343 TaxID=3374279 RepID=UPI00397AB7A6